MAKEQEVIRMAFCMMPTSNRTKAVENLMELIPHADGTNELWCWWIAEDDEHGTGDEMSTVFVHAGLQHAATSVLTALGMTNVVEPAFPKAKRREFAKGDALKREKRALKLILGAIEDLFEKHPEIADVFGEFEV